MANEKTSEASKDERDMAESVDQSMKEQSVDVGIVTSGNKAVALPGGIPIDGLESVPTNILPVPFVRLVQGTSSKIELENGEDAPVGSFYFNDLQRAYKELPFVLLRAKYQIKEFEREGKLVPTKQILLLGMTLETKKLFILTLSVMSFSNFGGLIAKFKEKGVTAVWEYEIKATSEKMENKKGKFQIANFQVVRKVTEEELNDLAEAYGEYGGVLDREDIQEAAE